MAIPLQEQAPQQTVAVVGPEQASLASIQYKLEETNLLLRAMVILLCNLNDTQPDAILALADGSVLGLQS